MNIQKMSVCAIVLMLSVGVAQGMENIIGAKDTVVDNIIDAKETVVDYVRATQEYVSEAVFGEERIGEITKTKLQKEVGAELQANWIAQFKEKHEKDIGLKDLKKVSEALRVAVSPDKLNVDHPVEQLNKKFAAAVGLASLKKVSDTLKKELGSDKLEDNWPELLKGMYLHEFKNGDEFKQVYEERLKIVKFLDLCLGLAPKDLSDADYDYESQVLKKSGEKPLPKDVAKTFKLQLMRLFEIKKKKDVPKFETVRNVTDFVQLECLKRKLFKQEEKK